MMLKNLLFQPALLWFWCAVLSFSWSTQAAAGSVSAGDPVTSEQWLRGRVSQVLHREGYLGQYPNGQGLQRGLSAYLWDNRSWLKMVDFHNSRKLDAVVCLLDKKGYPGFADYLESAVGKKNWCNLIAAKP